MSNTNTGGPAFPSGLTEMADDTVDSLHKGMNLRDYFAAKAMQMLRSDLSADWTAERAYEMADAMLKARDA